MVNRRDKVLLSVSAAALLGILLPLAALAWFLWQESVVAEEKRLAELAQRLGEQTEAALVDARELLDTLNQLELEPCSPEHLERLQDAAIARPHVRAIGYWRAAERQCGAGFVQGEALTPPRASRIYDTGVVAWWPSADTAVGGVELFLMRFGRHDVAIDPRLLISPGLLDKQRVGLWVEGLPMIRYPVDADLPSPDATPVGLSVDRAQGRIVSRFSLDTIFPVDIIAVQPLAAFWDRYLPTLIVAGLFGLLLVTLWLLLVLHYLRRHLSLASELREAIANERLSVEYQPIVDLADGRCRGAEALARWHREGDETIRPDVFVPLAEDTGQATALTLAILRAILRDLGDNLRAHPEQTINLNITGHDLASDRFGDLLRKALREAGVSPSAIKLELTERSLLNEDAIRARLRELRQRGHRIAIDDFGTGYSSLSYLEHFELDTLKIDKSFTDAIAHEAVTSNVISHIIEMARTLRLQIVAEGIESAHQVEWLRAQGVEGGQGYHFSRPLSAEAFLDWCRQH
ncbi:EAL domain-containing protein [Thioalkalivibrio sp. ALMg11]|uniref:EAL domain-containing protein n=1 Tax=Thioalkalivibrio sp. ALMg11 TaxID=1158165 RepID=UPI0003679A1B|nr:EAL domain-containing protein [Thioalkalivibrio sp. ALMg11]